MNLNPSELKEKVASKEKRREMWRRREPQREEAGPELPVPGAASGKGSET